MAHGIYIHFPYCPSKCPYCDFAVKVVEKVPHQRYSQALLKELELRKATLENRRSVSLYIGGGTPSMWDPAVFDETIGALRTQTALEPDLEFTLEANPDAADAERFASYRKTGVNRLSIGVQSFDPATLKALGRKHSGDEAERAFHSARSAGFTNVTLDFIFGAPGQTVDLARADILRAISLSPEHLSCYGLTLDRETLAEDVTLAKKVRRGEVKVPDDEAQSAMGYAIRAELAKAGYERYEVSNYGRDGFRSRHNQLYWSGGEYLGLGCGAVGFSLNDPADPKKGGRRYGNHRNPDRYMKAVEEGALPEEWSEELTAEDLFRERMIIGLRMVKGVDLVEACARFGVELAPMEKAARRLVQKGLGTFEGGVVALTERGLDFHSEAAIEFV